MKGEKGDQGEAGTSGDYAGLINKPRINNVELDGNKTSSDFGFPSDYNEFMNKPRINGVELNGNKTSDDLSLASASQVSDIEDDVSGLLLDKRNFQCGNITGESVPANSYKDFEVVFSEEMRSVPVTVASFVSSSTAGEFGACTLACTGISRTGFTIRCFNNGSIARIPNYCWMAFAQ